MIGLPIAIAAAALGAAMLTRWNWRGTFVVLPAGLALLVVPITLWALWPLFAAVLCGTVREYWRAEDIRKGQGKSRHARDAIGPIALTRNLRDRRRLGLGVASQRDRYALGVDQSGAVTWLPLGIDQGRHALVIGATGSGKTTTMLTAASAHMAGGCGLIAIDAKGNTALVNQLRELAATSGRPFRCFTLTGPSSRWNPLAHGTPSERADKLIAAEDWSETHYKRLYQRYLLTLFKAIDARSDTPDIAKVVELLRPEGLAFYAREIENETAAEQVDRYLTALTDQERRDLAGLRNRLALLAESEHSHLLRHTDDIGAIDLRSAITERAITVFSLNTSRYPETAKLLGSALFQDLKHVVGVLETSSALSQPALVLVDEFGAFGADDILGLFQRARSAGLSLMLGTQELADLARIAPGFQDQVLGNVETIVAHRQNVPASAELVAEIAGTREIWIHSFHAQESWREGGETIAHGNKHRGHEFVIAPDAIKQLGAGAAVVITKNPHDARVVSIHRPEGNK